MARSGEFDLIKKLTSSILITDKNVVVGVGDDCTVIRQSGGRYLLATVDVQVDGVHFLSGKTPPDCIGQKAVAVAVSDIAAMGGIPTHCLVSLFLPKAIPNTFVEKVYAGIRQASQTYAISIVGGNITRARQFAIDMCLLGEVEPKNILLRSTARVGDKVLVTGSLGDAAAGLHLLQHPRKAVGKIVQDFLIARQTSPTPRVSESTAISRVRRATAMIDISDGLVQDILHITKLSRVGVTLYEKKLPLSPEIEAFCKITNKNPLGLALTGGEDYELLFTVPPSHADSLKNRVEKETGTTVHEIGEITKEERGNWLIRRDGRKRRLHPSGWDHLRV